ncbi:MAG: prolyl oligopeptidase family serine peptidase [Betaproteobacteria bacterium]|jgi:dipeptidyl aminopeptidase/acylaminoacyl peptidase|nr:S9 family peptidase [Rubrivivax sp.]
MKKPRPLDAATLWRLARLGAPSISPCGSQAVLSVTTHDADRNQGHSQLWRLHADGRAPRELTTCGDKDGQPAWSPRGDRIAFISRRPGSDGALDKTPQLYAIPADGGEARRLAHFAPGIESFKWFADGRRIVFAAWSFAGAPTPAAQAQALQALEDDKSTGVATPEAFHRHWDHDMPRGRRLQLWLLDADRGRVTPLTAGSAWELPRTNDGASAYDVRPDGRRVCFVFDPAAEPRLGNPLGLAEVDVATRRVGRRAVVPGWELDAPAYSPDGRRLACLAAHTGRVHTAPARPALVAADGMLQPLCPDWDRHADTPLRWTADGQALRFAAEDRGRRHLWRLALDAAEPAVEHAGGWVQAYDAAGDTLLLLADSAQHPPRVWARQGGGAPRRLESFNDRELAGVALGEVRETQVTGAQGEPVQVWLTFPPGFDARRRHAVLHVIHGGPFAAAGDGFGWRWNPHVLAAPEPGDADDPGRVVVQVNYHGSSGFGHAFRHSLIGRQGELELQDLEAATDWVCTQRWADRDRIAASGGSYGGFLVAWMNGHVPAWPEGRYRAYVCHAGVFDRVGTFSADSWPVRPLDLGADYWQDLPRVLAQSPHAFAARMATPTLVIHGARDYRVPDANGLAYFHTLKARGVPARLLWFADENHWVLKPANSLQWHREFRAWVAQHTGPARARRRASSGR